LRENKMEFMPHGHCFYWEPSILWLHIVSDLIIGLSYYSIPLALLYLLTKRTDLIYKWMFLLFAVFILACGTGHFIAIFTMFKPWYRIEGFIKLFTALASLATAISIWPLIPKILTLPSPTQLRRMRDENNSLKKEIKEIKT